jgi:hypothetical protein
MRKRRTREHIIADLSVNHVERFFLRGGHTAQRIEFDYGYDLYIQTFDDEGYVENGFCLMQLKATDRIVWVAHGAECVLVLERRDWEMWRQEPLPVFLLLYDTHQDRAYWLDIQSAAIGTEAGVTATVSVRIPATQMLDDVAVRQMRERKNQVLLQERGEHDTER